MGVRSQCVWRGPARLAHLTPQGEHLQSAVFAWCLQDVTSCCQYCKTPEIRTPESTAYPPRASTVLPDNVL
ncbi:hypothetical protein AAFF_G00077560 [Aldrovandia affinis]|uniref:Uncharacterized protein n=1 Tax=Aldrovandia affinis TaxID=143900 RepID=A0AAD7WCZ6_9TELE|nr:hypothetical protein AAFF_G00077560 [Aldrovandia affinis]